KSRILLCCEKCTRITLVGSFFKKKRPKRPNSNVKIVLFLKNLCESSIPTLVRHLALDVKQTRFYLILFKNLWESSIPALVRHLALDVKQTRFYCILFIRCGRMLVFLFIFQVVLLALAAAIHIQLSPFKRTIPRRYFFPKIQAVMRPCGRKRINFYRACSAIPRGNLRDEQYSFVARQRCAFFFDLSKDNHAGKTLSISSSLKISAARFFSRPDL
ncbi:unnamed protein product, partial [Amoebophrya sp. A120]